MYIYMTLAYFLRLGSLSNSDRETRVGRLSPHP